MRISPPLSPDSQSPVEWWICEVCCPPAPHPLHCVLYLPLSDEHSLVTGGEQGEREKRRGEIFTEGVKKGERLQWKGGKKEGGRWEGEQVVG